MMTRSKSCELRTSRQIEDRSTTRRIRCALTAGEKIKFAAGGSESRACAATMPEHVHFRSQQLRGRIPQGDGADQIIDNPGRVRSRSALPFPLGAIRRKILCKLGRRKSPSTKSTR